MKYCILVGAGYSIKEGIERGLWDKIKNKEVWSLNSAFITMPFLPTRQLWVDKSFLAHNFNRLLELLEKNKTKMQCKRPHSLKTHAKYATFGNELELFDVVRERKFLEKRRLKDISHIFIGGHGLVGFFGLSMAIREEYEIIYLLGYDWGTTNTNDRRTHYYQDKIKELNIKSHGAGKPSIYLNTPNKPNKHIKDFEVYLKEASKIYNVSLKSNIPYFPKISWEEFFKKIENE